MADDPKAGLPRAEGVREWASRGAQNLVVVSNLDPLPDPAVGEARRVGDDDLPGGPHMQAVDEGVQPLVDLESRAHFAIGGADRQTVRCGEPATHLLLLGNAGSRDRAAEVADRRAHDVDVLHLSSFRLMVVVFMTLLSDFDSLVKSVVIQLDSGRADRPSACWTGPAPWSLQVRASSHS
jgi:hypothetical protein